MQFLEDTIFEKDGKIREISSELERTQKILKMFNTKSTQLDQILCRYKSFDDRMCHAPNPGIVVEVLFYKTSDFV